MQLPFEVQILLSVMTLAVTLYLGWMVYLRNTESWTNKLFFILSLLISVYIGINFVSLHPPDGSPETQLLFIRLVMFITSFIGPILVLFVHTFPQSTVTLKWRYLLLLGVLTAASAYASITSLVFSGISYPNDQPIPQAGPGIGVFILDFAGLFLVSFGVLLYKYLKATEDIRPQVGLLFLGVLITFSLMALSTVLFVVILETSAFVFFGPIFSLILMAAIAYAIVQHQFLNIKVITARLLVGAIWVLLFAKLVATFRDSGFWVDAITFVFAVVIGIFVIRSVTREVEQREKVERLAQQLEEANRQLKVLDARKSEFINLASHQLRTPLTSVKGYASMLLEGSFGELTDKMRPAIEHIYRSSDRLVSIVADYLTISRIEQDRLEYEFDNHDLREVVETVYNESRQKAECQRLEFSLDVDEGHDYNARIDKEKIIQVISNLVDNAISYTYKGLVHIQLFKKEERYCIEIKDTGIGMTEQDKKDIFKKFTRSDDSRKMESDGSGLGLYIAKRIIEAHGGNIEVYSDGKGEGSTFTITLPTTSNR